MAGLKGLSSGICSNIHGNMASPVNMSGRARVSNSAWCAFSSAAAQPMGIVSPSAYMNSCSVQYSGFVRVLVRSKARIKKLSDTEEPQLSVPSPVTNA